MRKWSLGVWILIIAGLTGTVIYSNIGSQTGVSSTKDSLLNTKEKKASLPQPGYQAPDFTLTDINGKTVKLSDLRGKKIVINFWASWCPPCRAEMPDLVKKSEIYKDKVVFLGVNLTNTEGGDLESVRNFLQEFNVKYQILLDKNGDVAKLYQAIAIPTTVTVDSNGIIVDRFSGMLNEPAMEKMIQNLLKK